IRAGFRPWRPLALELQRRGYAARGWVLPGSSASVLHGRWPSCGVAEKARIGRDLFRSEDAKGTRSKATTPAPPPPVDWLADDAVSCKLVSTPNSLLTGKLTGNFAESGHPRRFPDLIKELIQRLAAKFPTQRNREFLQP